MNEISQEFHQMEDVDLPLVEKKLCEVHESLLFIGSILPPGIIKSIVISAGVLLNMVCRHFPNKGE